MEIVIVKQKAVLENRVKYILLGLLYSILATVFLVVVMLVMGYYFKSFNLVSYIQELRGNSNYVGEDVPRERFFIITRLISPCVFFILFIFFSIKFSKKLK